MSRDELVGRVFKAMGVLKQDLPVKGRTGRISRAKAVLIHSRGMDRMGLPVKKITELTRMWAHPTNVARRRGREFVSENPNKLFN